MKTALVGVFLGISVVAYAWADSNKEQDQKWFSLQKLSIEVFEAEDCVFQNLTNKEERERLMRVQERRTDVLVKAIEEYLEKHDRAKGESIEGYKFRVWQVILKVGADKARPMDAAYCRVSVR